MSFVTSPLFAVESHRLGVGPPNVVGLPDKKRELAARSNPGTLPSRFDFLARQAVDELVAPDDGERDAAIDLRVAHDRLWLTAGSDRLEVLKEALPHHDDAAVAPPEMLAPPIGDRPLPDPADKILVHDVACDPAARRRIGDRCVPAGNAVLHERLAILRHACEEPADAERRSIVDRHAPFEVIAGEQRIRPEADTSDRP